ncbi:mediator complex subunit MED6 SCDLUD_004634 [Saccharomycodes ludwigii]|uniref:mediator complex subunit MED6 n=1 Tax=Saccharomycodes ludwigii TaxID=36035 RepID=UPI001E829CD6|nr:hypothetical protein SCDLUD_004634 [Saccharomycodes ludwigii]KAH3899203.1 hypothetical protein SCDLUD_004634 [Saccharomycodes ludwigii]
MSTEQQHVCLDELQWKSPEWIQTFGLRTDNVLDYFAESPFFIKTSNNQLIKMQQQFSNANIENNMEISSRNKDGVDALPLEEYPLNRQFILQTYPSHSFIEREFRKLNNGIEYVLWFVREPDFWVIRKQSKEKITNSSSTLRTKTSFEFTVLQDYYIIGANVYMAPQLGKILNSRLLSTNYHLSNALNKLSILRNGFTPAQGFKFIKVQNQLSNNNSSQQLQLRSGINTTSTGSVNSGSISSVAPSTGPNTLLGAPTANSVNNMGNNSVGGSAGGIGTSTKDLLTQEVTDKLLLSSIKSQPVYI